MMLFFNMFCQKGRTVSTRTLSITIFAAVIFCTTSLLQAAGLGKLTVYSGLGQPLRAEIELLAVEKDEVGSLAARLASSDAFQQAGIAYSTQLAQLKLAVDKNNRGQPVIKVTSAQPFDEPFLDLLVELSWSSGRIVREYTALLDPPDVGIPLSPPVALTPEKTEETKPVAKAAAPAAPAAAPETAGAGEYGPVKSGDTLSSIAREVKADGVNLEQALVSLYRANQNAFRGNMNRLKTGYILRVPDATEFTAVGRSDAIAEVKAQTADWNSYRQKLAQAPVAVADAGSAQSASGKISVADAGAEKAQANEVLRISRAETTASAKPQTSGALQERVKSLEEEVIAKEQAVRDANERVAILEKQVEEMKRLVELKGQVPAAAVQQPELASAPVEQKPEAGTSATAPAPPAAPKAPESSLIDDLLQNPLYLAAIGLIVILGALLAFKAIRRRQEETAVATVEEQPFAIEHEQVVEQPAVETAAVPGEEIDPLSEAEVYLAYDREQQAEEILKDGLRKNPNRHEIHLKLLEIYSRRKDFASFNSVAQQLHGVTGGMGPVWERAAAMGILLAPNNPLYAQEEPIDLSQDRDAAEEPVLVAEPAAHPVDTIPGLDFEEEPETSAGVQTEPAFASDETLILHDKIEEKQPVEEPELTPEKLIATIDFNAERRHLAATETDINFERPVEPAADEKLDFTPAHEEPALSFDEPAAAHGGNGQSGDLSFGSGPKLSEIDLNFEDQPSPSSVQDEIWQQVETKFDLARAYQEMGEKEGAREILEEVIKDGDAKQQRAARSMLATL
jgi:pilus assembly protein FimV